MTNPDEPPRGAGRCMCGAVAFEVRGPLRDVIACHCDECRRSSGSYWAATLARRQDLTIIEEGLLTWYESSPGIRRGFCGGCGSSLFWDKEGRPFMAISAGSLDKPTGLNLVAHIFTAEAGDYYPLADRLPAFAEGNHGVVFPPPGW